MPKPWHDRRAGEDQQWFHETCRMLPRSTVLKLFTKRMAKVHPDKCPANGLTEGEATVRFQDLSAARDFIRAQRV